MSAVGLLFLVNAALLVAAWALLMARMAAATGQVRVLEDLLAGEASSASLPSLTVVVTARDEDERIEASVRALLSQRYPSLQIVVVDDRSTDRTGPILDRLAGEPEARGRLDVIHNRARPEGWLGKCHACRVGAERGTGEWILFKDGDVELVGADLLARIVGFAERRGIDHLALVPDMNPMPLLQAAVVGAFGQTFLLLARAHEMERDLPRGGAGIGAFNLVRRRAYEKIGGHENIRMDPGDDVKLGQLLKESGARQRIYFGLGLVKCPWQRGTVALVRGLEKNAFSGLRYSLLILLAFTVVACWFALGPVLVGILATAGWPVRLPPWAVVFSWTPFLLQQVSSLAAWFFVFRRHGIRFPVVLLYPPAVLVLCAATWNSAIRTLVRGGIEWRGDFYALEDLRRGLVLPGAGRSLGAGRKTIERLAGTEGREPGSRG